MWDSCMSWLGHNGLWRDLAGALVFCSNNTWPLSARGKQMISFVYYSVFHHFLCIVFFFFFCSLISDQTPPPGTRDRTVIFGTKSIFYHFYFYWSFLKYCVHMTPLWKSGCTTELDVQPLYIKGLLPPDPSGPRGENQQHGTVGPWS